MSCLYPDDLHCNPSSPGACSNCAVERGDKLRAERDQARAELLGMRDDVAASDKQLVVILQQSEEIAALKAAARALLDGLAALPMCDCAAHVNCRCPNEEAKALEELL